MAMPLWPLVVLSSWSCRQKPESCRQPALKLNRTEAIPGAAPGDIPRTLALVWKNATLPAPAQRNLALWKAQHLDVHVFSDDECKALAAEHNVSAAFAVAPLNIMRADLCRYMAVLSHGGLYADLDVALATPHMRWMRWDVPLLVGRDWEADKMNNWFFGAVAGHPALRCAVQACSANILANRSRGASRSYFVHDTTGPHVFDKCVQPYCGKGNGTVGIRVGVGRAERRGVCYRYGLHEMTEVLIRHQSAAKHWHGVAGYTSCKVATTRLAPTLGLV